MYIFKRDKSFLFSFNRNLHFLLENLYVRDFIVVILKVKRVHKNRTLLISGIIKTAKAKYIQYLLFRELTPGNREREE